MISVCEGRMSGQGSLDTELREGRVSGQGRLDTELREGRVSGQGKLNTELRESRVSGQGSQDTELREGRVSGQVSLDTELREGRMSGQGRLHTELREGRMSGQGRLDTELRESRVSGQGRLNTELREGRVSGQGRLDTELREGRVSGQGSLDTELREGRMSGQGRLNTELREGRVSGQGSLDTELREGRVSGQGSLDTELREGRVSGQGRLDTELREGRVSGQGSLDTELRGLRLLLADLESVDSAGQTDSLTGDIPESGQVCDRRQGKLEEWSLAEGDRGDSAGLSRPGLDGRMTELGDSTDFTERIALPSPRMIGRFNSQAGEVVGTAVMNGKPPTGYRKSELPVRRATPIGEDLPGQRALPGPLDPTSKGRMEIPEQSKWLVGQGRLDKPGAAYRRNYLPEPTPVKRCVGPVNEVSIVYRRPASPSADPSKRPPVPLSPHIHIVDGGSKRAMSPAGELLPSRQAAIGLGARCLSPPSGAETEMSVVGVCCEHCNNCLIELKRQALRLMFPDCGINTGRLSKDPNLASKIAERLEVPQISPKFALRDRCDVCDTHIKQLKQEAVAMVHSIQQAQCESAPPTNIPALVGSCNFSQVQRNNPGTNFNHPRISRQTKIPYSANSSYVSPSAPIAAQAQAYLEQNVRAWISPKRCAHVPVNRGATPGQVTSLEAMNTIVMDQYLNNSLCPSQRSNLPTPVPYPHQYPSGSAPPPSLSGSTSSSPSAAASFFARAAQKLSISSKRKKKHHPPEPELPSFPTNFCEILRLSSPPAPPCLMRGAGRVQTPGAGKVKVMLRICPSTYSEQSASFLSVDPRKKQVTVYDPSHCGYASASQRRTGVPAPKMFAFDAVFCPDDSVTEICSSSLTEIVQAVVNGADGCLFSYGHARFGKSQTIVGRDQSSSSLGVIPCAIAWLFKLINEQKEKTGARFSVRVSAVEVTGKQESLRDLLSDVAQGQETGVSTAPGVYLREDPICGTQLENQSELRAPTADKAAFYLDAALAARSIPDSEEEAKSAHLLFTLHVYQYRIEKSSKAGLPAVAGGRSRLHLIDLGSCSKSKDPGGVALSLSALGNVILALLNGQRHVPHRDSKIAQLLRDSLGNLSCRTCMIAHVTPSLSHHNESLQVIQLAARIHRMRRRKNKFSSTSSEESSCEENGRLRRYGVRGFRKMGTLREDVAMSHSDPDYTSSSEQSCDTVIYMGSNGQSLSDRELTDGEGPPRHVPRTNPRLPSKSPRRTSGSKSSGDEGSNSDSRSSYSSLSQGERGRFTVDDSLIKIGALPRLPHRSSSATKSSGGAYTLSVPSPPMSPHITSDSQQRKVGIRTTVTKPKCPSDSEDSSSLQSFGMKPEMAPSMPRTNGNLWYREKGENGPLEGEKWIDGPGVEIYPEASSSERWVDGPGAYRSSKSSKSSRSEHRKHSKNPTVSADEKWVDGPTEMVVRQNGLKLPPSAGQPEPSPRKHENKFGPSQSRRAASEKLAKCSVTTRPSGSPKHIVGEQERPTSMASVDSNVSLKVQTGDSRPVSSQEGSTCLKDSSLALKHPEKVEDSGVKPFVRDWVERHAITADCTPVKSDTLHSRSKRDHSAESSTLGKHGTCERQKSKLSGHSPQQSPGGSPVSCRKSRSSRPALQKTDGPTLSGQSSRVAEWVKSVSGTNGVPIQSQPKDSAVDLRSSQCVTKGSSGTATMQSLGKAPCKAGEVEGFKVHIDGKDVACDMSTQSSSDILEADSPTSRLLNRESLYEVQFDEQIEVFKHDDETFSSVSGTKEPEITDRHCELAAAMCAFGDRSLQEQLPSLATCLEMSIDADLDLEVDRDNEGNPCPPAVSASNKARLRCPDGASNPNLSLSSCEELESSPNKDEICTEILKSNTLPSNRTICASVEREGSPVGLQAEQALLLKDKEYGCRSADGQADPSVLIETSEGYSDKEIHKCLQGDSTKQICSPDASKPPIPQKSTGKSKPSALPKLFSGSSSKNQNRSASSSPARGTRDEKAPLLSKPSSVTQNNKSNGHVGRSKEKSSKSSSQRSGSQPVVSSPTGSGTNRSCRSNKSQSPSRSKLPIFSRKDSKESKSSSKSSHKSFGFSKKDKDKNSSSKAGNVRVCELTGHKAKGTDSDSGNDSGIVANERKKLLSPYATVTQPRTPSHSSSGHGSDNSSVISSDILSKPGIHLEKLQCGASSGYESMLRDSEATGTSSSTHEDTASESSGDRTKGSKGKKRPSSTRRSRSAPARSPESPSPNKRESPDGNGKGSSPSSKAWVDTRYIKKYKEEPFHIQSYGMTDIERMQKWRSEDGEPLTSIEERTERIRELLGTQTELKQELTTAKDTLLVDRSTWSFDCKLLLCFSCRSRKNETKS